MVRAQVVNIRFLFCNDFVGLVFGISMPNSFHKITFVMSPVSFVGCEYEYIVYRDPSFRAHCT